MSQGFSISFLPGAHASSNLSTVAEAAAKLVSNPKPHQKIDLAGLRNLFGSAGLVWNKRNVLHLFTAYGLAYPERVNREFVNFITKPSDPAEVWLEMGEMARSLYSEIAVLRSITPIRAFPRSIFGSEWILFDKRDLPPETPVV